MNDFKQRLIHLHQCKGVNWNIIYTLLKKDPQLKYLNSKGTLDGIPPENAKTIRADLNSHAIINNVDQLEKSGIYPITIFDPEYPILLRETYKAPWVLYTIGDKSLLTRSKLLAVVGSRKSTYIGEKSIEHLFPKLIQKGVVIVSGLAMGIDAHAHQIAMKLGGHTIAVIAGGFHQLYPKENILLAQNIMKNDLIISEYPPNTRPQRWHFPMRNRIIAGISHGTLVVEATRRSGSLITANYAVHEGREVFSIPGSILDPSSVGTNELIQQGAKLVHSSQDILEELFF